MLSALRKRIASIDVARFNRLCAGLALAWLVAVPMGSLLVRKGYPDFAQYYLAGQIVRQGAWSDLYPIPRPGAENNAGGRHDSLMRPKYAALAREHGAGDVNRYMQPPAVALPFVVFTVLSYQDAYWVWVGLMVLCTWGTALMAGRLGQLAGLGVTRVSGVLTILVACSPLAYRTIRLGQISPLVGLCVGWAILELVRRDGVRAATAIATGTLAKYATALFCPVAAVLGRWRTLVWLTVMAVVVFILSLVVMGWDPYAVWLSEIRPTLKYPHHFSGNQSLLGMLRRMHGGPPPDAWARAVVLGSAGLLLVLLVLIVARGRALRQSPPHVMAACAALLAWWTLLSPIFWTHYYIYLCPLWGYLAWEMTRHRWIRVVGAVAIAFMWLPLAAVPRLSIPEPFNSHMLFAAMLVLMISVIRLLRTPGREDDPAGA